MTKTKTIVTLISILTLSGCSSFDMSMLNPFDSSDEKDEMVMTAEPVQEAVATEEQLNEMYKDWQEMKPELMRLLQLESKLASVESKLSMQSNQLSRIETSLKSRPKPEPTRSMSSMSMNDYSIQIAAASTKSAAEQAWMAQKAKFSNFLSQYSPEFARITSNNKSIYRVKIGNFATQSQAQNVCRSFQSQGGQCIVRK